MAAGISGIDRVAVLGAGMLGVCLALLLTRRGVAVSLFDEQPDAMRCAGRWNEGKIHQGYIYSADKALDTARKLLPGARCFERIVSTLVESPLAPHTTSQGDVVLTHADSVVRPDETFAYFQAVWALGREAGMKTSPPTPLSEHELRNLTTHPSILAAYSVPEHSIDTRWVASRLAARVRSEPHIETRFGERVLDLFERQSTWTITTDQDEVGGFTHVVNALWQGRAAIDAKLGLPAPTLSYRYRAAVFARASSCDLPNFLIATGPFGDFKNYDGQAIYLSWYPAGLVLNRRSQVAPAPPVLDEDRRLAIFNESIDSLAAFVPEISRLQENMQEWVVGGGWVVAPGDGELSNPTSELHKRDSFGIARCRNYLSVDVGKYSMAPLLAEQLADQISR